ncbi:pilus assembly protein [Variovorax sp. RHLX14]|uniref:pilus assembly protein n=1 Tax=Variovorax sp. RHLX14 TaxID=1259731 RepID=UPI003F47BABC
MTSRRRSPNAIVSQRGVALIVVMIVLVIVSLLGIGSTQLSMMTERGARNDRDAQLALQAAEATLLDAVSDIDGTASAALRQSAFTNGSLLDFEIGCGAAGLRKGLCSQALGGKPVWQTVDLADESRTATFGQFTGRAFATAAGNEHGLMPAVPPRYIIEALEDRQLFRDLTQPSGLVYRVTALGFGSRQDIQAVVQMLYRKKKD